MLALIFMHELSDIARDFLSRQDRGETTCKKEDIIEFFNANKIPVFEPVVNFQEKYSGYIFNAGAASISFRLIQGEGGLPFSNRMAFIVFEQGEAENSHFFVCATSDDYPMTFEIDELGRYYEDRECIASCFGKRIEDLAIREELMKLDDIEYIGTPFQKINFDFIEFLDLDLIPHASDEYTQWYKKESTYLRKRNKEIQLFAPRNLKLKDKIEKESNR